MRLPEFIVTNLEPILVEFEEFARTHTLAGESMDIKSLRDHAEAMLRAIALDLEQPQSERAQKQKSKGDAPAESPAVPTAAEKHGSDRAGRGFSLEEMFSEYRALRASVLRLWTKECDRLDHDDLQDLIRFNEAIDQAVAESVTRFSTGIEHSREMFLAILGHDLRSPLGAVLTASSFLVTDGGLTDGNLTLASRILSSGERMQLLVRDLLDFTRSRLGPGIPITRVTTDLRKIGRKVLDEIAPQHPDREIRFEAKGNLEGRWDAERVSQALANLVGNAVQHGSADTPVIFDALGESDEVIITVRNGGVVISPTDQQQIFDPFKRIASPDRDHEEGSMGLGLYIAQQIALAHGGWIDVESSEQEGTKFEIHLPRDS